MHFQSNFLSQPKPPRKVCLLFEWQIFTMLDYYSYSQSYLYTINSCEMRWRGKPIPSSIWLYYRITVSGLEDSHFNTCATHAHNTRLCHQLMITIQFSNSFSLASLFICSVACVCVYVPTFLRFSISLMLLAGFLRFPASINIATVIKFNQIILWLCNGRCVWLHVCVRVCV